MKKLVLVILIPFFSYIGVTGATVDRIIIFSKAMNVPFRCIVIKPDNYSDTLLHFPVVYLLHGYNGSNTFWEASVPGIKEDADRYQMLLVCPEGYNSWYLNSPIDTTIKFETYIGNEVPEYVDSHYRTIPNRNLRAITGISMGGYGAFNIGLRNTGIFGAVGSISGAVDFLSFKNRFEIERYIGDSINNADNWMKMNIINMIAEFKTDSLLFIFDCGTDDYFIEPNRKLHARMLQLKIPHDYIERPGSHSITYWQNAIEYQLLFFHKYFKKSIDQNKVSR
jgi:S-formylglutathione hydrolase FrmB